MKNNAIYTYASFSLNVCVLWVGLRVGHSKQPLPLWFGLFDVRVQLDALQHMLHTTHRHIHTAIPKFPLKNPQDCPFPSHPCCLTCMDKTSRSDLEMQLANSAKVKGLHLKQRSHRNLSRNKLIIREILTSRCSVETYKINIRRWKRFPGGGCYPSEAHATSHPYGEFLNPKEIMLM